MCTINLKYKFAKFQQAISALPRISNRWGISHPQRVILRGAPTQAEILAILAYSPLTVEGAQWALGFPLFMGWDNGLSHICIPTIIWLAHAQLALDYCVVFCLLRVQSELSAAVWLSLEQDYGRKAQVCGGIHHHTPTPSAGDQEAAIVIDCKLTGLCAAPFPKIERG